MGTLISNGNSEIVTVIPNDDNATIYMLIKDLEHPDDVTEKVAVGSVIVLVQLIMKTLRKLQRFPMTRY